MTPTIHALMVTKNEAGRYLEPVLSRLSKQVDSILVYDDASTDDTADIASQWALVDRRTETVPGFMEHEGAFRNAALASLVRHREPRSGDWILVVDADEYFVRSAAAEELYPDVTIQDLVRSAVNGYQISVGFTFRSIWSTDPWMYRIDHPWPTLRIPRLWRWWPQAAFADKAHAPKNAPPEIFQQPPYHQDSIEALHMGYATKSDRSTRFKRYSDVKYRGQLSNGRPVWFGHNPDFIQSIIQDANCAPWFGEIPS